MTETRRTLIFQVERGSRAVQAAYRILCDERASGSFKWRGASISIDDFETDLFAQALCVFAVTSRTTGDIKGVFLVGSPELRDGHAFIEVAAAGPRLKSALVIEGSVACIDYVFANWPFHKLYADVDDVSIQQFRSIVRRGAVIEGYFREHKFRAGERIGVTRLALYESDWAVAGERLRRAGRIRQVDGSHAGSVGGGTSSVRL